MVTSTIKPLKKLGKPVKTKCKKTIPIIAILGKKWYDRKIKPIKQKCNKNEQHIPLKEKKGVKHQE